MKRIGLIVNPYAGLGGRAGFKGSDDVSIQERALEMGVVPEAPYRALLCLRELERDADDIEILCGAGEMGEDTVRQTVLPYRVEAKAVEGRTTAADTKEAARELLEKGADLLLFAGGDGTARDIMDAVETKIPVIGIPAGVKIHSAVYAMNPQSAGKAAHSFVKETGVTVAEAEVMDIDEELFRQGQVEARLYGYLMVPQIKAYMQGMKAGGYSEAAGLAGIAMEIVSTMENDVCYVIGPGTTTRGIMEAMGLENTLLGVDVVCNKEQIGKDLNEQQLVELLNGRLFRIIITIIGGQGHVFGRGNQQLSPRILQMAGRDGITIVATRTKLIGLGGRPMTVDTGDPETDQMLSGYYRVVTGYQDYIPYKIVL